jgi:hypothetical protein
MSGSNSREPSQNAHTGSTIRDGGVARHNAAMAWWRVRQVLNGVNGSTLAGLAIGAAGRCAFHQGPRGLVIATGYRLPQPRVPAFTVGNVVLTPHDRDWLDSRPRLLAHEERHASQYVACLGLPMLPLYAVASGWSYLRGGDFGVHNPFERAAGLADGGYPLLGARARRRTA